MEVARVRFSDLKKATPVLTLLGTGPFPLTQWC